MIEFKVDPYVWFCKREVEFYPKHFTLASTPLTSDSKQWVLDNLKGRFCIVQTGQIFLVNYYLGNIAFEDPSEATFYELKWS
jgi:hypothetical protein